MAEFITSASQGALPWDALRICAAIEAFSSSEESAILAGKDKDECKQAPILQLLMPVCLQKGGRTAEISWFSFPQPNEELKQVVEALETELGGRVPAWAAPMAAP